MLLVAVVVVVVVVVGVVGVVVVAVVVDVIVAVVVVVVVVLVVVAGAVDIGPMSLERGLLEPLLGLGLAGSSFVPFGASWNHFWASG